MDETTTAENSPLESLKNNGLGRAKRLRGQIQAMLVPPATTDSETLQRWPANQAPAKDLEHLQAGDLAARVAPEDGTIDAFPTEHPWAAVPFATDELKPLTFDAPPTTFVAEQSTAQAAAFTRRLQLTQWVPFLVVPADMRPRRITLRPLGAGNMSVYLERPQNFVGALDQSGYVMVSTDSPITLQCTGEVWVASDTATQYANVIVDYSAVEAVRTAQALADRIGSVLAATRKPCGCGSH